MSTLFRSLPLLRHHRKLLAATCCATAGLAPSAHSARLVFDNRMLELRTVLAHEKTPQIVGRVPNFWGCSSEAAGQLFDRIWLGCRQQVYSVAGSQRPHVPRGARGLFILFVAK